ncbi:MAG TPA: SPOR domain-containing protein [Chlorobaculum sp.]|nr:SPOR domain-containing protein [Chlorobaculum sp.]
MDLQKPINPDSDKARSSVVDEGQALEHQLDRFSGALIAELLAGRPVVVDGLGLFSVVHDNASRESTESGSRFLPPRNRVTYEPRSAGKGDSARIAVERLDMKSDEAARLAVSLSGLFERSRKQFLDLKLRGVGSFSKVEGRYGFQPEPSLEELLNSAYEGLKTIDIPENQTGSSKPGVNSGGFSKKAVALLAALVLLAGGGYVVSRQLSSHSLGTMTVGNTPAPVKPQTAVPVQAQVSVPAVSVQKATAAMPDSVTLSKGRFTVVTSTFTSRKIVLQEMQRLSQLGHRVMVWPVIDNGKKYYRIVAGDFETHRSALDSVKTMPKGLSKNTYIQQAPKNVVLYGEKGL